MRKILVGVAAALALAIPVIASGSVAAGQMIVITSVSVSPDRHVTVTWSGPPAAGLDHGAVQVATRPDRGSDGYFFSEYTTLYDFFSDAGRTSWTFGEAIEAPGTYYASVRGWWSGYSEYDFDNYGVVYSQVVPFTVDPICSKVLVKPGFYKKVLVKKGRWVKRDGKKVWIKPVYKKVWIKPVYKTKCR